MNKLSGEISFQTQGLKGTFDDFFNELIKNFEKKHSGCTIKWTDLPGTDDFDTTMVTQASNGTMADVVNVPSSTIMALSKADYLLDIETSVPGIGDKFVPGVWDKLSLGKNGEKTALPWYFGPFVVTYNKDIFKAAGLDPETPPKTMSEYLDFAKKITAAGKQAVYGNTSWYMLAEWRGLGVKVMNDDFTEFTFASDPNALLWLTTMAEMYAKGGIPKDSVTGDLDQSKVYGEGTLGFGTPNASFLRNIQKNAPQAYARTGVGPEPLNDGIKPLFSGQYIAVSKKSKNAPLAAAFAEYITDDEQGKAWAQYGIDTNTAAVFPVTTKALNELASSAGDAKGKDAFAQARVICAKEAVNAEAYMPDFYVTHGVSAALTDNVNLAITGDVKPQDALNAAQDKMNKMVAKLTR
ncbi:extracellular solute-binding protein [Cutibacterium sp.]|uniref:extracellular solute-binding protein n=1 Tax=Cutibacterium sp. TaxID=1912221 RepID=UPI0026DB3A31|nr:extracellular solute-binding protein [Cutibacterium sp.]MDO4411510.1 extracellular solute-binding protein [Cutibacterium sp.]